MEFDMSSLKFPNRSYLLSKIKTIAITKALKTKINCGVRKIVRLF